MIAKHMGWGKDRKECKNMLGTVLCRACYNSFICLGIFRSFNTWVVNKIAKSNKLCKNCKILY